MVSMVFKMSQMFDSMSDKRLSCFLELKIIEAVAA